MSDSKVVLVTGCARGGISYEYCKAFAEHKCKVFASDIAQRMDDIDLESLDSYDIAKLELDVSSDQSVESAVNTIISKCGHINVVINNAGIGSTCPLAELPLETIRRAWEINTLGQLRLVQ
ncbi:putative 7-alpha-hydroxysteroid dehydrogenase [Rosa chinensis]|uniref:Putative 7-alpha-hydroxysteroid dehydrogenase n=1 Tax=Rosa chinensis TaxID=74649 RepID=A0A2P6RPC2_ROSCH|nr:putative 7-alpha-hydroxysteroid dehydrogenase [Rosa chinensis]